MPLEKSPDPRTATVVGTRQEGPAGVLQWNIQADEEEAVRNMGLLVHPFIEIESILSLSFLLSSKSVDLWRRTER